MGSLDLKLDMIDDVDTRAFLYINACYPCV